MLFTSSKTKFVVLAVGLAGAALSFTPGRASAESAPAEVVELRPEAVELPPEVPVEPPIDGGADVPDAIEAGRPDLVADMAIDLPRDVGTVDTGRPDTVTPRDAQTTRPPEESDCDCRIGQGQPAGASALSLLTVAGLGLLFARRTRRRR